MNHIFPIFRQTHSWQVLISREESSLPKEPFQPPTPCVCEHSHERCFAIAPSRRYFCVLPINHNGAHIACASSVHRVDMWTDYERLANEPFEKGLVVS